MADPLPALDIASGATRLSDSISRPLERLFQAGGLTLVFIFVGFVSMVLGYGYSTDVSPWLFGAGTLIVFACLCLFLYGQISGQQKARQLIRDNADLLDSVQNMAIELTKSLGDMQSLLLQHNEQVRKIVSLAIPLLAEIPQFKNLEVSDSEAIDRLIVDSTEKSSQIIADLRRALETCDPRPLATYKTELVAMRTALHDALAKRERIAARFSEYSALVDDLGAQFANYSDCIDALSRQLIAYLQMAEGAIRSVKRIPAVSLFVQSTGLAAFEDRSSTLLDGLRIAQETNEHLRAAIKNRDTRSLAECVRGLKKLREQASQWSVAASGEPTG